jgi:succinate-semialdehyde dehydrogenase/glutarate-semialdehyde dehydrogenase
MAIVTARETEAGGRRHYRLQNPATLATVGELECVDDDEVRAAIARARQAQPAWAALSFEARADYLRRALRVVVDRQDHFVDVIVGESGKPRVEALMIDIFAACDSLAYYVKHAQKALEPERRHLHGVLRFAKKLEVHYRPLGVVGVIAPWNGPLILALNPTVQALMAGNTVVVKPSEVTPYSGNLVQELFDAAGLPSNVVQVVLGDGATGAAVVEGGVDKVHFTGSVETGRRIAEACGRQLIPPAREDPGPDG